MDQIIIGVDTHKSSHIAVAINTQGTRLALHEEIQIHEAELERLVADKAPKLMKSHGISTLTVAEMLILVGDNA